MDLVVYDSTDKENVICVYYNCELIPQKYNTIVIR